jgi:hypothetical protein
MELKGEQDNNYLMLNDKKRLKEMSLKKNQCSGYEHKLFGRSFIF